jgi:hypothetical protein
MSRGRGKIGLWLVSWLFATSTFAVKEEAPHLQPPHDELGPTFWEQRGMILVLGNLAFFMLLAALALWLRRPRKITPEAPDAIARRALEALRDRPEDPQLLMLVSRILRRYAVFAFCLPPDEFTTTELKFELQARPSMDAALAAALIEFLRQCDERKFSQAPSAGALGAVNKALELLEKIKAHCQQAAVPPVLEPGAAAPSPA